jgi:nucleotide-binding universal stress UspA family protein
MSTTARPHQDAPNPDLGIPVFSNILVALDGSPSAERALALGLRLARAFGAVLHVVFVLDEVKIRSDVTIWGAGDAGTLIEHVLSSARAMLERTQNEMRATGVETETFLRQGDVVEEVMLAATEWHADLLVAGTHAHAHSTSPALGSKTAELLRLCLIPVLVVR